MIVALAGGVGGAKLAAGLAAVLPPEQLTVIVNTGDDFEHLDLAISPDLDSVTYTMAGLNDPQRGWGLAGETWAFMDALERLGGEDWFLLGDRDLATHVERTRRLRHETLSEVTQGFCTRLGIGCTVAPMSDDPVRTVVQTPDGDLAFQHYFVRERCAPRVTGFRFEGAADARPSPAFQRAMARGDVEAVIVCPSNPYVSIDPILSLPGVRQWLLRTPAPMVAVSPIVGGAAVKGPAAKMMQELGVQPGGGGVAAFYGELLDGLVIDSGDAAEARGLACATLTTPTLMSSPEDRARLASEVLAWARGLVPGARR